MGCSSSKTAAAVYRPPPSSFAVFDITAIEEPWLKNDATADRYSHEYKLSHVPPPILEKLKSLEDAPRSWDEVSKALEDLKPKLNAVHALPAPDSAPKQDPQSSPNAAKKALPKNLSYHTLEELEAKMKAKTDDSADLKRVGSKAEPAPAQAPAPSPAPAPPVAKSLKDNMFIVRDRQERDNAGKSTGFVRRDPLGDFEERCPPGGADAVVIYTTSLGGVRRTYEDCNRVRQLMETHQVVFDERDVALDGGFLAELRDLVGEAAAAPRVFVKGRYIGGVEEVVGLNEVGRLSRILNWARVERGLGRLGCRGCGGARFIPCLGCGGSRKIVTANGGDTKLRELSLSVCGECNENGLVHCPLCAAA